MAITSLDQIIEGSLPPTDFVKGPTGAMVAGRPHSLLYTPGLPGAAVAPTPGIGGAVLTSYAGQLPFANPASGDNTYLSRLQATVTIAGTLMLCDRLWHNSGHNVTLTTEQTHTAAVDIPARDANGVALGDGVQAAVEVSGVVGAGTPTLTLKYTNEAGTAGKIGTNVVATVAASIAGTFYPIGLAAGDKGVRKAESLTLSATWTSGTIGVVLYRVLARLEVPAGQTGFAIDALSGGFPRLYDNTVPFLVFIPQTTTTSNVMGSLVYAQG